MEQGGGRTRILTQAIMIAGATDHWAMLPCQPPPLSISTVEEIPLEEPVYFFPLFSVFSQALNNN